MDHSKLIYEGNRAREVLENDAFLNALDQIKSEITEQWKTSPARDSEGREKLWMLLSLANKLEATLKSTLESGQLAEIDLNHKRSMLERVRGVIS